MKHTTIIKRLASAGLLGFLFLVVTTPIAHAQAFDWTWVEFLPKCQGGGYPGDPGANINKTYNLNAVLELMVNIMRFIFSIVGSLALAMFVWGGFQILLSRGESKMVEDGKKTLMNAVLGLALVFSSWMIVNFVMASILGSPNAPAATTLADKLGSGVQLWKYSNDVCTNLTPGTIGDYPTPTLPPQVQQGVVCGGAGSICCSDGRPPCTDSVNYTCKPDPVTTGRSTCQSNHLDQPVQCRQCGEEGMTCCSASSCSPCRGTLTCQSESMVGESTPVRVCRPAQSSSPSTPQ